MKRHAASTRVDPFERVSTLGLSLPGVVRSTRYDGSPVLKVANMFMAAPATHVSAEPATLVVRAEFEDRERLLEDAPDTYYVTEHYSRYPIVLVRLSRIDRDSLRDLLSLSRRLTLAKLRTRGARGRSYNS